VGTQRRSRLRPWIAAGVVAGVIAAISLVRGAVGYKVRRPLTPDLPRIDLEPVEDPGPWWRSHRRWLCSPGPVGWPHPVILNLRTGAAYGWRFSGNRGGHGWFDVSTRWAWLHPTWKDDPWVLVHDNETGPSCLGLVLGAKLG
jgi:hypothetical protein